MSARGRANHGVRHQPSPPEGHPITRWWFWEGIDPPKMPEDFQVEDSKRKSCPDHMDVSENSEFSPQIINFNRVFHYKPSILGYPYFWKHPYVSNPIESSVLYNQKVLATDNQKVPRLIYRLGN